MKIIWTNGCFDILHRGHVELLSDAEIMVVGADYKNKNVIGSRHVKDIIFFDKIEGYSTTKILAGLE